MLGLILATLIASSTALLAPQEAAATPRSAPAEAALGKVLAWTSKDGIPFEYRVPKEYDAARGANLVVVLHGNGLDQRWTFWNHPADEFRVDDIVVSPDGTSPHAGTKANEFLDGEKDIERFAALLEELKTHWNVRQTFLYGHSQGSFFVFHFAGHRPQTIDGVVGHASGKWASSPQPKNGKHLAIGVLHGTDDHVPYAQGWHAAKSYREAGYPLVHLRTLFDWPHRPNWVQAQQMLAWCEGTTSDDPARVASAMETLSDPKAPMGLDAAALHAVAARLAEMEGASDADRRRAARRAAAVDALCAELCSTVERGMGRGKAPRAAGEEWLGIAIRLVEEFEGVPALTTFLGGKGKALVTVRKAADDALAEYWRQRERDPADALGAGLDLLENGWLSYRCPEVSKDVEKWLGQARELKLPKRTQERAREVLDAYAKGRSTGFPAFERELAKIDLGK